MTATVSRYLTVYRPDGRSRGGPRVRNGSELLELRELLANPGIAVALGALIGVGLLAPVLWGLRFFTAGHIEAGLGVTMGAVFGGLLLALGLLFGYRALAPDGIVWFGPAMVGGYVVALGVFAIRAASQLLNSGDDTRR